MWVTATKKWCENVCVTRGTVSPIKRRSEQTLSQRKDSALCLKKTALTLLTFFNSRSTQDQNWRKNKESETTKSWTLPNYFWLRCFSQAITMNLSTAISKSFNLKVVSFRIVIIIALSNRSAALFPHHIALLDGIRSIWTDLKVKTHSSSITDQEKEFQSCK